MTMNLSGSLDAFGLDEVLALLGMGGRTARMQVTSAAGVGSIHLVDGEVSAASADCTRAGLLRQVVAAVPVPASDLVRALEHADPVRALVDSGTVDRDVAQEVSAEHLVDALGEMLAWGQGEFAVWAGEADPGDIGTRVPVDEAVARGRARAGEWERVRGQLPEPDSILALAPSVDHPPVLALDDWSMLARIDGRRTLAEVLAAAGCAPLIASDRMVDLMGRGLVQVRSLDAAESVDEVSQLLDEYEAPWAAGAVGVDPAGLLDHVDTDIAAPFEADDAEEAVADAGAEGVAVEVAVESAIDSGVAAGMEAGVAAGVELPAAEGVSDAGVVWALETGSEGIEQPVAVAWGEPEVAEWVVEQPVEVAGWTEPDVAEWVESAQVVTWNEPEASAAQVTWTEAENDTAPTAPSTYVLADPTPAEPVPPVATERIAAAVEWSPWAQALGLGAPAPAGELAVDPLAGPGIAQMIADATGMTETTEIPVPLAPVAYGAVATEVDAAPAAFVDPVEAQQGIPLGAQAEAAQVVPAPRAPEEFAAPIDEAEPVEEPTPVPALAPPPARPDPLAGGLLSHLIDSVRGI
jgi:hypothetical protein